MLIQDLVLVLHSGIIDIVVYSEKAAPAASSHDDPRLPIRFDESFDLFEAFDVLEEDVLIGKADYLEYEVHILQGDLGLHFGKRDLLEKVDPEGVLV